MLLGYSTFYFGSEENHFAYLAATMDAKVFSLETGVRAQSSCKSFATSVGDFRKLVGGSPASLAEFVNVFDRRFF